MEQQNPETFTQQPVGGQGGVDDESFLYGNNQEQHGTSQLGKRGPPQDMLMETPADEQYFVVDSTPGYGVEGPSGNRPTAEGHGRGGMPKKKKRKTVVNISPEMEDRIKDITLDQVKAENKTKILVVDSLATGHFICTICNAPVNSIKNLETHIRSLDHIKRVKMFLYSKTNSCTLTCELCSITCPTGVVYEQHLVGKKHAKALEVKAHLSGNTKTWPISENIEFIFKEEVVKEGTALTLGVTPIMMSLLKLEGPFIGLKYAQEIGTEDENSVPNYFCTLCDVLSEAFNFHLHYASSLHRTSVLKKDYPEEYESLKPYLSDSSLSRGQVNAKIKEIAMAIETREGRNVEVIQRKIVVRPNIKGMEKKTVKPKNPARGGGTTGGNWRDNTRGRGRGKGNQPHQQHPQQQQQQHPQQQKQQHPQQQPRFNRNQGGNQPPNFSEDSANTVPLGQMYGGMASFGQQQQQHGSSASMRGQKKSRGGNKGRGANIGVVSNMPRYGPEGVGTSYGSYGAGTSGAEGRGGGGSGRGKGRGGKGKRGRGRDDYGVGTDRESLLPMPPLPPVGYQHEGGSYSSLESSSFMSSVSDPVPNMANVQHLMTMEKLRSESGDKTEAYKKLALQMIKTEEDAEQAFQLSSALTQALLEYRMKSFSNMIPDASPISSLLNLLQKP